MSDATGVAEAMLGLPGFRVLGVEETAGEVIIRIEDTVMAAVREHGSRSSMTRPAWGAVTQLGVDETTFLAAAKEHPTLFATGLVDLERRVVIDVVEGNAGQDLGSWLDRQPAAWRGPRGGHGPGRVPPLGACRASGSRHPGGRPVPRGQSGQPLPGSGAPARAERHPRPPGQEARPLYRIRKLLVTGAEGLDGTGLDRMLLGTRAGDPDDEVLGAWLAKESVRDVYITNRAEDAEILLDKAIGGCRLDAVGEVRSLGRTLARWCTEILNHHRTGASNGPTEGLNLLVKKVKRADHGLRSFANNRLRILLHAGRVAWHASRPPTPQIRHALPTEIGRAVKTRINEPRLDRRTRRSSR